jgi:hypothetical protein
VLGWSKRYKLAHAFMEEYNDVRLKLARLLGQLGVFITWVNARSTVCISGLESPLPRKSGCIPTPWTMPASRPSGAQIPHLAMGRRVIQAPLSMFH